MEGPEQCKEYFRTPQSWVGVSRLPVGAKGGTDPGHVNETEVFLCVRGSVEIFDGDTHHRLDEDDALVIPPGVPHTITNVGAVTAMLVWSGSGA
jgi:mannose-6-phosphate isomerase-like protein (cupin superfamily)